MLTEDVVGILFLLEGLAVSALAFAGFAAFVRPSIFLHRQPSFRKRLRVVATVQKYEVVSRLSLI